MNRALRNLSIVAALAAFASSANAQTIGCVTGGAGGAFPATGTGGGGTFPTVLPTSPVSFTLNVATVPAGATHVTEVKLLGLNHTYVTDLQFVLTSPAGATTNLLCRATTPTGTAFSCEYGGDYTIIPQCIGASALSFPSACTSPTVFTPGTYEQFFGAAGNAWPSGTNGINNTRLDAVPAATGAWTLTVYDWAGADVGTLTGFDVCFGTPGTPSAPSAAPTLTTPANNAALFGPSVTLNWSAVNCATAYDVEVDGVVFNATANSFVYTSAPGSHLWRVRGKNAAGVGTYSALNVFNDLGVAPTPCSGPSLTLVPFTGGNGLGTNSAVYFDVDVFNPAGISFAQLNTNANATVGTPFTVEIWTKPGTYGGFELNAAAWTLRATGGGVSVGNNVAGGSLVEFPDVLLPQGLTGMALRIIGAGHSYTNGNGTNQAYSNADLAISAGVSQGTLFTSAPINPRVWNGTFRYNCTPPAPTPYCTSSTSTNGCSAAISASAQPSASQATPCTINVANVEGQKQGLVFYGLDNNGFTPLPWSATSTSFFCVKSPVQRTFPQSSNGTINQCNGAFAVDLNNFFNVFPSALGLPFTAGDKLFTQAWFRDPPASKTTNLSNAIEMTMQP
jgi:subtilisin-like proprotein convertase family protein